MRVLCFSLVVIGLVLGGCSEGEHEDGHEHHGGAGAVDVPQHYGAAVEKCEQLSKKIDSLITEGHLKDVHAVAAEIKKIAEKLPALAKRDLPPAKLREVSINARKLAGMFSEIDMAADAGKKDDTIEVHDKMKGLIADLKEHSAHAKEGQHDD